jgi:hypothetical protein
VWLSVPGVHVDPVWWLPWPVRAASRWKAAEALGFAAGIYGEYAMNDDEEFMEAYRPGCERAGAYLRALYAVSTIQRAIDDVEAFTGRASRQSLLLTS